MADIMAARPCDRPPEPLQRQEQGAAPGSPGTMTPDCPAPEGDARHSQATLRAFPLPKGAGQNDVWMKETLRQRKPHLSSPEGAARLTWATLSYFIVAQGCSTARLSDTSARFRRPKVLGKRRKVESDKKRRSLPKTRETSVGCPKPGSNRHVFKGHWILSPTRLPIPPFGHIHVDFPLDGNFALPLQRSAKLLNFLRYSKTFNNSLCEKNVNFLLSGKKDLYRINTAVDASYPVESRLAGQT